VLHVYCCVAAVSSANCLVKLCSVQSLAATVTEYLGYFFIAYVEITTQSLSPHTYEIFFPFLPYNAYRSPDNWALFLYIYVFLEVLPLLTYNSVPWEWVWMEHLVTYTVWRLRQSLSCIDRGLASGVRLLLLCDVCQVKCLPSVTGRI